MGALLRRPAIWILVLLAGAGGLVGVASPGAAAPAPASCSFAPEIRVGGVGERPVDYRIEWTPAADEDPAAVFGYVIERRLAGDDRYSWRHRADVGTTTWLDDELDADGRSVVGYRIRTRDQDRSFSPFVDCALADTQRPSPPRQARFIVDGGRLSATWQASTDDVAVTGYRVFRDDDPTRNGLGFDTVLASPTTNRLQVMAAPAGTYRVYVMAYDAAGNQSWRSSYTTVTVAGATTPYWHTADVDGRWEIINPVDGEPVIWEAVNVRGDGFDRQPLDRRDIARLADRFQYVRLVTHWDQLHPQRSALDPVWVQRIRRFLDLVAAHNAADDDASNDIGIILEPAHLGGGARNNFWIPEWAWREAGFTQPDDWTPQNSYLAWAGASNDGERIATYLDLLTDAGVLTHPTVIAVEVVNEPHPRPGLSAVSSTAQWELATVHAELIEHIQTIQSDAGAATRLVVVGAYYGGTRHGGGPGADENGGYRFNHARTWITEERRLEHVVWTAHNYFHGVGDDDGLDSEGRQGRGLWGDATFDGGRGAGCYTTSGAADLSRPWACDDPPSTAAIQAAHAANAAGHDRYAQAASMPFFMGEWGITRQRVFNGRYVGWDNAARFFCDKLGAYRDIDGDGTDVAISWAVWSFDSVIDDYGLYNPSEQYRAESRLAMLEPNRWSDGAANNRPFPTAPPYVGSWSGSGWGYAWPFAPGSPCRPAR